MMRSSHPPCRTCREQHKKCDCNRPCGRCAKVGRDCEEPVKKKRGRPSLKHAGNEASDETKQLMKRAVRNSKIKKSESVEDKMDEEDDLDLPIQTDAGEYNYDVHDPRLMSAHRLLLSAPEIIFNHPVLSAGSFGINLGPLFFVAELPAVGFPKDMTFDEHMIATKIRFITEPLLQLFQRKQLNELPNMASFPWEPECMKYVCEHVVRDSVTTPLPTYGVREWNHRRRLTTKEGKFSALCTGFILSNLRVMFVNVGDLVRDETIEVPPAALIWDDKDVFFDLLPYSDDSGTSAMELFDM